MKRKLTKKALITLIVTVASCAALGTGLGVKAYRHNETVKAEAAAEEKEYADLKKAYTLAEREIKHSIFEDDTNKGDKDAQEKARKAESDKLLKYKAKIKGRTLSASDKKAFKALLKEIKAKYDDSNQLVSEVSQAILSEDTGSLGTYYTDDLKSKDASEKAAYEKAMKDGDYKSAYDHLNAISKNFATATNTKTEAEQKAAEEAKTAAEAAKKAEEENTASASNKTNSKSGKTRAASTKSSNSKTNTSNKSTTASTNKSSASTASSTTTASTTETKDWKHSPIDYSHYYTQDEVPDGWIADDYTAGVPMKIDAITWPSGSKSDAFTMKGAKTYCSRWPNWSIMTLPNGYQAVYAPLNGFDADGYPLSGVIFIKD